MKIHLPNESKQTVGGGFTFHRNFKKYCTKNPGSIEIVDTPEKADIVLISGATLITKEYFKRAKNSGAKIVLRVDNAVKDSRNRGAGMSRLLKYAKEADLMIFQSLWAREYLRYWFDKNDVDVTPCPIIYNGADTDVFFPNKVRTRQIQHRYLFIKNKNFNEAAYYFSQKFKKSKEIVLTIVGRFPHELVQYNFDFFNGETIKYFPQIEDPNSIATLMRNNDVLLFPAFADACPQTVVEALNCGMKIDMVDDVGGTKELLQIPPEVITLDFMGNEYYKHFIELL